MHKRNCTECSRFFPAHLISGIISGPKLTGRWLCPICALRVRNEIHGLPEDTPFTGSQAKALHAEALIYVAEHYPEKEKPNGRGR